MYACLFRHPDFQVGDRVSLKGNRNGIVRYIGRSEIDEDAIFVGIDLDCQGDVFRVTTFK